MSVTMSYINPQRRLLNYLFDHPKTTVKTSLADADAGLDDVRGLVREGLLQALDDDRIVPVDAIRSTTEIWLDLTVRGDTWVCDNPENRFLRVLDAACAQESKLTLAKAIKAAGADTVLAAVTGGYAIVVRDETLAPLPPSVSVRRLVTDGNVAGYALVDTPKIRRVLGPR